MGPLLMPCKASRRGCRTTAVATTTTSPASPQEKTAFVCGSSAVIVSPIPFWRTSPCPLRKRPVASPESLPSFRSCLLLLASGAMAQAPIYFVGIQRGCERDGRLDQAIERRMNKGAWRLQLLRQASGVALPVCYGGVVRQAVASDVPKHPGSRAGRSGGV